MSVTDRFGEIHSKPSTAAPGRTQPLTGQETLPTQRLRLRVGTAVPDQLLGTATSRRRQAVLIAPEKLTTPTPALATDDGKISGRIKSPVRAASPHLAGYGGRRSGGMLASDPQPPSVYSIRHGVRQDEHNVPLRRMNALAVRSNSRQSLGAYWNSESSFLGNKSADCRNVSPPDSLLRMAAHGRKRRISPHGPNGMIRRLTETTYRGNVRRWQSHIRSSPLKVKSPSPRRFARSSGSAPALCWSGMSGTTKSSCGAQDDIRQRKYMPRSSMQAHPL